MIISVDQLIQTALQGVLLHAITAGVVGAFVAALLCGIGVLCAAAVDGARQQPARLTPQPQRRREPAATLA